MSPGDDGQISDEDLQRITVGERRPHNARITLVDYDEEWPDLFDEQARCVRAALGERALRVDHVGSTSVPGLCAKPVIDMLLVVPDSADETAYVPPLEASGYVLWIREPEWFEHRLFVRRDARIGLHVFSSGSPEVERMLRFRDRLRSNDADRDEYARVKRELARREWRHVQHYADAKSAVIEEILSRADAPPDAGRPRQGPGRGAVRR
jgi:GrpB-like predicted nucleotidyltransferase (UPF0157 family)